MPASVQGVLRTQSVNRMVYLLAHTSFRSNRLMVRELDSGRSICSMSRPLKTVGRTIRFKSM